MSISKVIGGGRPASAAGPTLAGARAPLDGLLLNG